VTHALGLLVNVNLHIKFQVPSFIRSRDVKEDATRINIGVISVERVH